MVFSATYYIDFDSGNDSNNGTSTSTPWKTIPGSGTLATSGNTSPTVITSNYGSGTFVENTTKIPAGTIFKIKPGTTWDYTKGGRIHFRSNFYRTDYTLSDPVKFISDQTWASGTVTFDGTSISAPEAGYGLIHINESVGGLEFDGSVTSGFTIQNAAYEGVSHYNGSRVVGINLKYIYFYSNGQSNSSSAGASQGHINLYQVDGGTIDHCVINGNSKYINGFHIGESNRACINIVISNCEAYNLIGSEDTDQGYGYKVYNSQVTFNNCTSHNNVKGFDLGQEGSTAFDVIYKVINSTAYDNDLFGLAFSSYGSGSWAGSCNWYVINSIFYGNGEVGVRQYSGPGNLYIVHSVFDGNGSSGDSLVGCNFSSNPDESDTNTINVYLYNNIFYKPYYNNVLSRLWIRTSTRHNWYADYNSYIQRASENFASWGTYAPSSETASFSYGANGPGHSSGNWYNYYGASATVPTYCIGHHNSDANSKGTGATDTTAPQFTNASGHDYTLTSNYAGSSGLAALLGAGYISEMGTDRNGVTRTSWDIGAYEYGSAATSTYTRGAYASLPSTSSDLSTTYSAQDITDVGTSDDTRVAVTGIGTQYVIHQLKYAVSLTASTATVRWEGQSSTAPSTSGVYLQCYNNTTTAWADACASNTAANANTDFTLSCTLSSMTDYRDANGYILCRVYQRGN